MHVLCDSAPRCCRWFHVHGGFPRKGVPRAVTPAPRRGRSARCWPVDLARAAAFWLGARSGSACSRRRPGTRADESGAFPRDGGPRACPDPDAEDTCTVARNSSP